MKSLRKLTIPVCIDTSRNDLTEDFFKPLLSAAVRYDRGVGFFSSGWLHLNASGMVAFAANGGRARWITSPILAPDDWKAMQEGNEARRNRVLHHALSSHHIPPVHPRNDQHRRIKHPLCPRLA